MGELELTPGRWAAIGWLLLWRGVLGWSAIAFALLVPEVPLSRAFHYGRLPEAWVAGTFILVGLIWGPMVLRMALRKKYRDFRIVLAAPDSAVSAFD